jgi:hypothetical protein
MKFDTIYLPIEEAIPAAAKQNFATDCANGIWDENEQQPTWLMVEQDYLDEARAILSQTGENYQPEIDGHPLIKVLSVVSP